MKLTHISRTEITSKTLTQLLQQAQTGDFISLLKLKQRDDSGWWRPHPDGVVVRNGNKLVLNGRVTLLVLERKPNHWEISPQGEVILQYGREIWLGNKSRICLLDERDQFCCRWEPCENGVIVERSHTFQLFLNNKRRIYEGEQEGFAWQWHPKGFVVHLSDHNRFLLNGKTLLYDGEYTSWEGHEKGVIIQRGADLFLNGKEFIYRMSDSDVQWSRHQYGALIQEGDEILLAVAK